MIYIYYGLHAPTERPIMLRGIFLAVRIETFTTFQTIPALSICLWGFTQKPFTNSIKSGNLYDNILIHITF